MKPCMFIKLIAVLIVLTGAISCAQKDISETSPVVEEVTQTESVKETNPVTEQVIEKDPRDRSVIEQITTKPEEEDTAVTYPRPVKIKSYASLSKEDSWFLVGGVAGERAYSIFVDPETIRSKNGLVTSWSKLQFEEAERDTDGLSYKEVQINSSVDCEKRTYSYIDSKFYDALGRLVENQIAPYDPQPIVADTVSAKIADFVCGYELNRTK